MTAQAGIQFFQQNISGFLPSRLCRIQRCIQFLTVMPDLIRHPELQNFGKALDSGSSPE
jgi:hypothetical protein